MGNDYEKSKKWLYSLKFVLKGYDLENMKKLIEIACLDLSKLKTIHVAGSNGKGSTCAFISSILTEQGYKTGLYTSPHLVEPTERMKINGADISEKRFSELVFYFKTLCEENNFKANYFEIITAMAFKYFIEEKVDFLVAEVGLGGRLDATNVLNGIVNVITQISKEHTQTLGNRIDEIALQKAGIIKEGSGIVVTKTNPGLRIIEKKALEKNAKMFFADWKINSSTNSGQEFDLAAPLKIPSIKINMIGEHQIENASVAAAATIALREKGFACSTDSIRKGLEETVWRGRLEKIQEKPLLLLDSAHNAEGWEKLFKSLELFEFEKLIVVFGVMNDKDLDSLKGHLEKADRVIVTKSDSFRAEEPEVIINKIGKGKIVLPEEKAIKEALEYAGEKDLVLVTGSIYVVGEALRLYNQNL